LSWHEFLYAFAIDLTETNLYWLRFLLERGASFAAADLGDALEESYLSQLVETDTPDWNCYSLSGAGSAAFAVTPRRTLASGFFGAIDSTGMGSILDRNRTTIVIVGGTSRKGNLCTLRPRAVDPARQR
jgi:hypothetical protein